MHSYRCYEMQTQCCLKLECVLNLSIEVLINIINIIYPDLILRNILEPKDVLYCKSFPNLETREN